MSPSSPGGRRARKVTFSPRGGPQCLHWRALPRRESSQACRHSPPPPSMSFAGRAGATAAGGRQASRPPVPCTAVWGRCPRSHPTAALPAGRGASPRHRRLATAGASLLPASRRAGGGGSGRQAGLPSTLVRVSTGLLQALSGATLAECFFMVLSPSASKSPSAGRLHPEAGGSRALSSLSSYERASAAASLAHLPSVSYLLPLQLPPPPRLHALLDLLQTKRHEQIHSPSPCRHWRRARWAPPHDQAKRVPSTPRFPFAGYSRKSREPRSRPGRTEQPES